MILKIKQGGAKGWTFIGTNIRYFMRDEGYNTFPLQKKKMSTEYLNLYKLTIFLSLIIFDDATQISNYFIPPTVTFP